MAKELSLLDAYRITGLELQEALIHNEAPRVLTLVLKQSEILQQIQMKCQADPSVRAEVSCVLKGLSEQIKQNGLLLSQVSASFDNCAKEMARVHVQNNGYQRQQV